MSDKAPCDRCGFIDAKSGEPCGRRAAFRVRPTRDNGAGWDEYACWDHAEEASEGGDPWH
jgi:hypothetical protein